MAEKLAPLSPIILPGFSISMSTIISTEETLSAAKRILPASSGAAGLVGNVGSTNSNALTGSTVQPKKVKKVTYISIYVYNHLIFLLQV
jgi:hypothetical protein